MNSIEDLGLMALVAIVAGIAGWTLSALVDKKRYVRRVRDDSRCAICGWPLSETAEKGCVRGNCSMRPFPTIRYDPERAMRESPFFKKSSAEK